MLKKILYAQTTNLLNRAARNREIIPAMEELSEEELRGLAGGVGASSPEVRPPVKK
ncbi:MAG: hypothetical protein KME46_35190 [Brasilonema angustatum HA4187-MV1]|jgi:hypothetical protein|nr:hypothetical protein [Brasilonema angustatum HA4187-MV1]